MMFRRSVGLALAALVLAATGAHSLWTPRRASEHDIPESKGPQDLDWESAECPQNYVIGALNCGMTALVEHLHTGLDLPPNESHDAPHTFDSRYVPVLLQDPRYHPTIDGTPNLRNLIAALRMKAFCKFKSPPKFVVTVCDPADRAWSQFKQPERAEQLAYDRLKHRDLNRRSELNNDDVLHEYETCVEKTLGPLKACMEKFSYKQCEEILFGDTPPGRERDSLGQETPCSGIIMSSLFGEQLDYWTGMFSKEDFLVIHRDRWLHNVDDAVKLIGKHFDIPVKAGVTWDNSVVDHSYEQLYDPEPPAHIQQQLRDFFSNQAPWGHYLTWIDEEDEGPEY